MAFVVEDGTGLPAANAYIDVAFADAYHADRNRCDWSGTTAQKQAAIVRATDFIDQAHVFRGSREKSSQALQFPREHLCDDRGEEISGVPIHVRQATAEYARLALKLELFSEPTEEPSGAIKRKSEQVGPLREDVEYVTGASGQLRRYPLAERMLRGLTNDGSFLHRS